MNDKQETANENIELIDIDDLRTAFGGEGVEANEAPTVASAKPGDTIMCSGWSAD
ncbi:MAG: hypothetical protein K0V04_44775 [Deltaproteobacteria bacterium]|nr:hypothetical protein [Deltaproteobacteria bacterium]